MRSGPCEHCGSPDKAKQCRYTWWMPYKESFIKSGADRPCDMDEYSDNAMQENAALGCWVAVGAVAAVTIIVLRMLRYI